MRLLPILKIELVQCFYMIAGERNRHKHDALLAEPCETLERVIRLWSQPRTRPNLGLPHEAVGIRMAQAVHHGCNGRRNLEHIRVPAVDDGHREGVCREEEHDVAALFFGEFPERRFDILGDSLEW